MDHPQRPKLIRSPIGKLAKKKAMGQPMGVDWEKVRYLYIYGDEDGTLPTFLSLSKKFDVRPDTIGVRAAKEKWMKARKAVADPNVRKLIEEAREDAESALKVKIASAEFDVAAEQQAFADATREGIVEPMQAAVDCQLRMFNKEVELREQHFMLMEKTTKGVDAYLEQKTLEGGGKLTLTPKEGSDLSAMSKNALVATGMAVFGIKPKEVSPTVNNYLAQTQNVAVVAGNGRPNSFDVLSQLAAARQVRTGPAPEFVAQYEEDSQLPSHLSCAND